MGRTTTPEIDPSGVSGLKAGVATLETMKRFLIGLVVGAALASGTAYAAVQQWVVPSGSNRQTRQGERVLGYGQIRFRGLGPERWAKRTHEWRQAYLGARRELATARHLLLRQPTVTEAINLACLTYGSCSTLRRRAECESNLNPRAQNSSGASGLYQFMAETFQRTPYGRMSIWSPYANAMAAGWMEAHGKGGQWVCR